MNHLGTALTIAVALMGGIARAQDVASNAAGDPPVILPGGGGGELPIDTDPPQAVLTLAARAVAIDAIEFTMDAAPNGNTRAVTWQRCSRYQLRGTTQGPIDTDAKFTAAREVPESLVAAPGSPGQGERFVVTLPNPLVAGETWHFAVKAHDERNAGGLSNPAAMPYTGDTTAPAAVPGLQVKAGEETRESLDISWGAAGDLKDDDTPGTVVRVRLAYNLEPIVTATQFQAAADLGQLLEIAMPATEARVTGLSPGTTYFFSAVAVDSSGNQGSQPATSPSGTTVALVIDEPLDPDEASGRCGAAAAGCPAGIILIVLAAGLAGRKR